MFLAIKITCASRTQIHYRFNVCVNISVFFSLILLLLLLIWGAPQKKHTLTQFCNSPKFCFSACTIIPFNANITVYKYTKVIVIHIFSQFRRFQSGGNKLIILNYRRAAQSLTHSLIVTTHTVNNVLNGNKCYLKKIFKKKLNKIIAHISPSFYGRCAALRL